MNVRSTDQTNPWLQILFALVGIGIGVGAGFLVFTTPDTLKLFVIIVGAFAFAVSVARVEWGLLVLAFIVYTNVSDIAIEFHGAPSVAKSFVLLLLFAILMRWIAYNEKPDGWQRATALLFGYGAVGFASILYAADPSRTLAATELYIKNALIVIVVVILLQYGAVFRRVIWALLAAGIFLGTLTVFQYVTGTTDNYYFGFAQTSAAVLVGASSTNRVSGPINDPNYYALIMSVLVPLALDRIWHEKNRWMKAFSIWAFVATAAAVMLTYSRSGFVILVFVLGLMFLYRAPNFKNFLILLLISLVLIQFVPTQYTDRLESLTSFLPGSNNNLREDAAIRGRASELLVGWNMFLDHPILGVGYDNYPIYYQQYSRQVGLDPRAEERSAHNLYIEILAETGIVGLIFFLAIIFITVRDIYWAVKKLHSQGLFDIADMSAAMGISFVGYLAASMFIHDAYQRYFWLIVGIAMAVPKVAEYEIAKNKLNALKK
mgnify:CR=1 FL=1